jgi:hypothetical protein
MLMACSRWKMADGVAMLGVQNDDDGRLLFRAGH